MTIQQLQYVLEISKTGSMTKAAKNLYMSQPNVSNSIKNLEQELGVVIFERTPIGMQLTPAGYRLVEKASSIIGDIQEITRIHTEKEPLTLRVVYPRYMPAFEAFTELCRKYQETESFRFSCYIGDSEKQIEALYRNQCDLAVSLGDNSTSFQRMCADMHVRIVPLMETRLYIQISENHPLLKSNSFDISRLKDYPYVAFSDLNDWNADWTPWVPLTNPSKLICVQSTSLRVSMVARTNAYSIVAQHSDAYNKEHHVVQIPFNSNPLYLSCLYSATRGMTALASEYIEFLKNQISVL